VSIKGMTMKTLLLMAQRLGMIGRGLRLEPEGLAHLRTPAILQGDKGLLTALAVGFGLLTLIRLAADWRRAGAECLRQRRQFPMRREPVSPLRTPTVELVRAVPHWRYRVALGAIRPITDLVAEGLVATMVDGLMAVLTLAMMIVYSPILAAIAAGGLVLAAAVRLGSFRAVRQCEEETISPTLRSRSARRGSITSHRCRPIR
jgi:ATP-binding cassette subfamily B protein RaxB